MEPIKSVTVVIFDKDKVLLVRNGVGSDHPTGIYGLPAGKVEDGESWEEAAKRECGEESGLIPIKLIKNYRLFMRQIFPEKMGQPRSLFVGHFIVLNILVN